MTLEVYMLQNKSKTEQYISVFDSVSKAPNARLIMPHVSNGSEPTTPVNLFGFIVDPLINSVQETFTYRSQTTSVHLESGGVIVCKHSLDLGTKREFRILIQVVVGHLGIGG